MNGINFFFSNEGDVDGEMERAEHRTILEEHLLEGCMFPFQQYKLSIQPVLETKS